MPPNGPPSAPAHRPSRRIDAFSRVDPAYLAYAQSIAHAGTDPRERLEACRHLVSFGVVGETVTVLTTLMDEPSLRTEVAEIMEHLRGIRRLRADEAALPDFRAEDEAPEDRGYWVVPANSDTTLIAFTGRAQRMGMSIYFMHSLFRRVNANVIYLFDWADSYYFAGVSGLGPDTDSTVERLRALCAELKSRRVLCIGQSAGGYAAIRYAVELEADGVIAFSPVILPVKGARARARIGALLGRTLTVEETDLRQIVAGAKRAPYIEVAYGADNAWDVASARHLAGLPRLVERPLPGISSHATLLETALAGTLGPMLDAFSTAVGPGAGRFSWRRVMSSRLLRGWRARLRHRG